MTKRKTLKELKDLVLEDLKYQNDMIKSFKGNENPQVKEMYNNSVTRAKAMEDILLYIEDGSKYQFNKEEE